MSETSRIKVEKFTGSGTWFKESWAQYVRIVLFGGGGGGGSGCRNGYGDAIWTVSGAGGGGGGMLDITLHASQLGAYETFSVAAPGLGGATVVADSTYGNYGSAGNMTTFTIFNGTDFLRAYGGGGGSFSFPGTIYNYKNGGGGGAGIEGNGGLGSYGDLYNGAAGIGEAGWYNGVPGPTASYSNNFSWQGAGASGGGGGPAANVMGGSSISGAPGGGCGGLKAKQYMIADEFFGGGVGGSSRDIPGGLGGAINIDGSLIDPLDRDAINGKHGANSNCMMPGSGGGGGAAINVLDAKPSGNGANGGIPGGGGGGGAPGNNAYVSGGLFAPPVYVGGNPSGKGGDGARGEIWVIQFEDNLVTEGGSPSNYTNDTVVLGGGFGGTTGYPFMAG